MPEFSFSNLILNTIIPLLNRFIGVLMIAGTIVFLWGIIGYLINQEEEKKKTFKSYILWSLLGLAIMVSIWGIIQVVVNTFELPAPYSTGIPDFPPASQEPGAGFFNLLSRIVETAIGPLIRLMFVLATAVFLWGMIELVSASSSGDEKKLAAGKKHIWWGIIGLFIMFSVWGIIAVLSQTFFETPLNPFLNEIRI